MSKELSGDLFLIIDLAKLVKILVVVQRITIPMLEVHTLQRRLVTLGKG